MRVVRLDVVALGLTASLKGWTRMSPDTAGKSDVSWINET